MNRGMTLVELLLALSFLAFLALAALAWTKTSVALKERLAGKTDWARGADAVLQSIEDDVGLGDFDPRSRNPRVRVDASELKIDTRSPWAGGPVQRQYAWDSQKRQLELVERGGSAAPGRRLLLEDVSGWDCELDEDEASLSVSIRSAGGLVRARQVALR